MRHVWVKARKAFSHGGSHYATGQVFQLPPLVAVRMVASRSAVYAKPIHTTVPAVSDAPTLLEPDAPPRRARATRVRVNPSLTDPTVVVQVREQSQRRFIEGDTSLNPIGIPTGQDD